MKIFIKVVVLLVVLLTGVSAMAAPLVLGKRYPLNTKAERGTLVWQFVTFNRSISGGINIQLEVYNRRAKSLKYFDDYREIVNASIQKNTVSKFSLETPSVNFSSDRYATLTFQVSQLSNLYYIPLRVDYHDGFEDYLVRLYFAKGKFSMASRLLQQGKFLVDEEAPALAEEDSTDKKSKKKDKKSKKSKKDKKEDKETSSSEVQIATPEAGGDPLKEEGAAASATTNSSSGDAQEESLADPTTGSSGHLPSSTSESVSDEGGGVLSVDSEETIKVAPPKLSPEELEAEKKANEELRSFIEEAPDESTLQTLPEFESDLSGSSFEDSSDILFNFESELDQDLEDKNSEPNTEDSEDSL